ncbi:oocyte zinc finger protein XlCOF8.4-like [Hyperolius riggenbachi]|uniref:oocyte zinc finger protein XlCOF8.4-like n=1 Tax=Hyperolius riggenbachi TaxID=752182 RepID=UPI0035A3D176
MRMEEDQSHMTERILNLTLEIIYLLTGEDYEVMKKTTGELLRPSNHLLGPNSITVPPPHSITPEKNEKILGVLNKITELLTGEVPVRWQDVTVYFSMEEWDYIEGHKDLYKDIMMTKQPPITSPGGSSNSDSPERCTDFLSSQDCLQEDPPTPHHYQEEDVITLTAENKEEEQEIYMIDAELCKVEELPIKISAVRSIDRNSPGIWAGHLYPQDCTQEDHSISHHYQGEDLITVRAEEQEVQEMYVIDDEPCTQEEVPPEISTDGLDIVIISEEHLIPPPEYNAEDNSVTQCTPAGNPITGNAHHQLHQDDSSLHLSDREELPDVSHPSESSSTSCVKLNTTLGLPNRDHPGERPFLCPECGKDYICKIANPTCQNTHTGNHPYGCSECRKGFLEKRHLISHQKTQIAGRPFSCSQCGKCFILKKDLQQSKYTPAGILFRS